VAHAWPNLEGEVFKALMKMSITPRFNGQSQTAGKSIPKNRSRNHLRHLRLRQNLPEQQAGSPVQCRHERCSGYGTP